jgi:hypothetical protein
MNPGNMKKIVIPFVAAILAVFILTPACKKSSDNNNTPVDSIPVLTMTSGSGYISKDTTLPVGAVIKFGLTAKASGTNSPITHLLVTRSFANKPNTVIDSTLSSVNFTYSFSNFANNEAGPETWLFRITDQLNHSKESSIVVTTTAIKK